MDTLGLVVVGIAIVVGLVGVLVPILPGLLIVWAAVAVWALVETSPLAWTVLGVATAIVAASQVVKYLLPGRRMRAAGVPGRAVLAGGVLGIVGFFVVPVVGLFLGFVLGVYLYELARQRDNELAWPATVHALRAVGLSIVIELLAGLLVGVGWLAAVIFG